MTSREILTRNPNLKYVITSKELHEYRFNTLATSIYFGLWQKVFTIHFEKEVSPCDVVVVEGPEMYFLRDGSVTVSRWINSERIEALLQLKQDFSVDYMRHSVYVTDILIENCTQEEVWVMGYVSPKEVSTDHVQEFILFYNSIASVVSRV